MNPKKIMLPITPLFTHPDFWIVSKPAGESFHSEGGEGFVARLSAQYPDQTFYPVHRLDKMTSGLLLFAMHKEAAQSFGQMFERHLLEKRYIAVSADKPTKKQGTVTGGMQPSRRGQWKLTKQADNFAVTQFFSFSDAGLRYYWIRPLTGKTHQIRVALKSLGAPILGDERYGGGKSDRGYLHAVTLSFTWGEQPYSFHHWPEHGQYFSAAAQSLYNELYILGQVSWPKFTIPKKV